ncbi:hypothetical protein N825_22160 [Skermanella stibiiresistens SB22]|uniref:DUF2125 domain-containing protein n=1 Tax=Skermanella stibiiresistens SB22 TaxID=1385369 RepID=W9GWJ1_9PROT|nr:DUF2125 domain-containing protein [Skermanella stibiiresistens]EWY37016.1 hypothetical protein N825_22160 [Skermanella stibiiresistens SB22]
MRAKPFLLFTVLLGLVIAGYTAWWFYLAGRVRDGVADWAAAQRAEAALIDYKAPEISGFPLSVTAKATDVTVRRADGFEWSAPAVVAHARPWYPLVIGFELLGAQTASLAPAGGGPTLAVKAPSGASGVIGVDLSGAIKTASADLADATVTLPDGQQASLAQARVRGAFPEAVPTDHTATALTIDATLSGVRLPPTIKTPFKGDIDTVSIAARVKGIVPDRLRPPAIAAWSESGGTIEIDSLGLAWGPLRLGGQGTLAFDRDLQPIGTLSAAVEGVNPTMDSLASAGVMRPGDAAMAKMALTLLSRRATPDNQPIVDASLTAQDGWLYFGPIRLVRIPRIAWE